MGQDRAQRWPRRSLSNTAGMAWECCACSAVTFGTCTALAFCSEAEASEAPETSQHKQHDLPQEQADVPPASTGLADSVQGSSRLHVQVTGPCLEAMLPARLSAPQLLQPRRLQIQPLHLQRRAAFSELLLLLFVSLRPRPSQASTDVPRRSSIPPARLPYS